MVDVIQYLGIEMEIIYNNLGLLKTFHAFNSQKPYVARACTYEIDFAFFHLP
jgi:hypothetical protein